LTGTTTDNSGKATTRHLQNFDSCVRRRRYTHHAE
jgi:hypothetical protein